MQAAALSVRKTHRGRNSGNWQPLAWPFDYGRIFTDPGGRMADGMMDMVRFFQQFKWSTEKMLKQICFLRKRSDMTMEEFMDYYENRHSQLSRRMGRTPSIPNAVRYVRRYLVPETNPVTGDVIDPGFDCIMEIWWNSREDFENSQRVIADPVRLPAIKEDETKLFASHDNPVCTVIEYDSPMGPNGEMTRIEVKYGE